MLRRPFAAIALFAAMALGIAACGGSMSGAVPAGAAATVNGTEVSADLLNRLVESVGPAGDEELPEDTVADAQRQILTSLVRSEIVVGFAADRGVELDDDQLQALVADAEDLGAQAEEFGISEEEYARVVLAPTELLDLVRSDTVGDVSQDELDAALAEAEASGRRGSATLSHILVETEAQAEEAKSRIDGGESFAEVAQDVSIDGSAAQGGSLGEAVPLDNFVAEFADAAADAPEGEVVGPVESQFGFHLIKVDEHVSIEESLREELAAQELQPELDAAFEEADVTVAGRYGEWDPEQRAVVAAELPGDAPTPVTEDAGTAPAGEDASEPS